MNFKRKSYKATVYVGDKQSKEKFESHAITWRWSREAGVS